MRVIAGKARRLPLKTLPGLETRPTTDRTKETLFNILQPYLCDCRFLDLCSGSGAIGIEALSRGAAAAVFVEKNPKAVECIGENLRFTKLQEDATVLKADAASALRMLEGEKPFDCIFMDPPYGNEIEKEILEYLSHSKLVSQDTIIIVEADLKTSFDYLEDLGFQIMKYKKYKTNAHVFIERKEL
ncbi:MAG: 16S rRNA (guanine(966)-N(2))-methyltransferase RsmD [Lachnospiraceae bacterium]|nr:16S rRNA (guanine(966)-N(2))-methyltransferase RsmD [Clostridiales bacterium]MDY4769659.1 16S rRNA (guanine(966)-N(2))-methyltransferase RsmD [Lachnospiraceae bacterium]